MSEKGGTTMSDEHDEPVEPAETSPEESPFEDPEMDEIHRSPFRDPEMEHFLGSDQTE